MTCPHEFWEREASVATEGYCPLCMATELTRLRAIETAARALKFSAYPAHGSGFVITVTGGNINELEDALNDGTHSAG